MEKRSDELQIRRKKAKKFVIISLITSLILMVISPWFSLFVSLLLVGAASWGWGGGPVEDISALPVISPGSERYDAELKKLKESPSEYAGHIIIMLIFLCIFGLSIFLLYIGCQGIISNLFSSF